MSIRPQLLKPKRASCTGSLFGAAIGSPQGGFWKDLAVSPPRTPPTTACKYEGLPPEFHLATPPLVAATSVRLDSIFPGWVHDYTDAALVTFTQSADVVTLRTSPRLDCSNVVHPTMILADAAEWKPMSCDVTGTQGHLFTLSHRGKPTCRIEVTISGEDVGRVAIVQPEYSPLAVAANLSSPSSLLVFEDVRAHVQSLNGVKRVLVESSDVGYVPTKELVATSAFGRLILATDHSAEAAVARRHWKTTKMLLTSLSAATCDCIDTYNESEFKRVGQRVVGADAWSRVV